MKSSKTGPSGPMLRQRATASATAVVTARPRLQASGRALLAALSVTMALPILLGAVGWERLEAQGAAFRARVAGLAPWAAKTGCAREDDRFASDPGGGCRDRRTGLVWTARPLSRSEWTRRPMTYDEAADYCRQLPGGRWRLPAGGEVAQGAAAGVLPQLSPPSIAANPERQVGPWCWTVERQTESETRDGRGRWTWASLADGRRDEMARRTAGGHPATFYQDCVCVRRAAPDLRK